jgi:glutamyl-Q tRNA(Asp) synthetase
VEPIRNPICPLPAGQNRTWAEPNLALAVARWHHDVNQDSVTTRVGKARANSSVAVPKSSRETALDRKRRRPAKALLWAGLGLPRWVLQAIVADMARNLSGRWDEEVSQCLCEIFTAARKIVNRKKVNFPLRQPATERSIRGLEGRCLSGCLMTGNRPDFGPRQPVGRFAPSPTGPLHFGSLVTAVGSFCLARQGGGRWILRMDDLDTPRIVPGAAQAILETLENLGFFWDGEIVWQSRRAEAYQAALERLRVKGLVFPCGCSRQDLLASAPHPGEDGPVYPGTCRQGLPPGRQPRAERIRVAETQVCFVDGIFGGIDQRLADAVGDFVLRRADGIFAYQLATVVDDAEAGVNQVVRGADLLGSTPRQIFLHGCLDTPVPRYIHLPLALGPDGEKISKRHGASIALSASPEGRPLIRALEFLNQAVPAELFRAPAAEVLAWGVVHFDPRKVRAVSRVAPWE